MAAITFQEVMEHPDYMKIFLNEETEIEGYFSNIRVDRSTMPEGWYAYDIREDDETGDPGTLEENYVYVNHFGTFLTQEKLNLPNEGSSPGRQWVNLGEKEGSWDYSFG